MAPGADELYALALEADQHLLGPQQGLWLERLDREREGLHALLEQMIDAGESTRALTLAGALARFWWMRGHTVTGRQRMAAALALPGGSEESRTLAWLGAGAGPPLGATSSLTRTSGKIPASSHASSALSTASLTQVSSAFLGLSKPKR